MKKAIEDKFETKENKMQLKRKKRMNYNYVMQI
jgi:hypothetical protein